MGGWWCGEGRVAHLEGVENFVVEQGIERFAANGFESVGENLVAGDGLDGGCAWQEYGRLCGECFEEFCPMISK